MARCFDIKVACETLFYLKNGKFFISQVEKIIIVRYSSKDSITVCVYLRIRCFDIKVACETLFYLKNGKFFISQVEKIIIVRYSSKDSITVCVYLRILMKYIRRGESMNNKKLLYVLVPVVICVVVLGIILFPKSNPTPADGNENEVVAVTENDVTELPEETEESETKVLDAPGTYSDEAEYKELTITSPDVVVENASVETLKIDAAVGDGDVTLRNVTAANLQIYGGGRNSIHIEGTTVENMVVARKEDAVRVVVDAASSVNMASLNEQTVLEAEGQIAELHVNAKSELTIKGNVAKLNVTDAAKESAILVEGSVASLISDAQLANLTGKDKVTDLQVNEKTASDKTGQTANKNQNQKNPVKPANKNNSVSNTGSHTGGQSNSPVINGNVNPPQGGGSGGNPPVSTPSAEKIVIDRVQSEYAKVIVTLSAPTSAPVAKEQISILCNSGGSDMTILNVTTTDNKTYEISTAVYKDNDYEIYMTLPDGTTISKVFEVRNDAPALTKLEATRINEGNADLFFVSDSSGEFYYLLQESSVLRAAPSVPTADQVKSQGIKTTLNYQANNIRISNLKTDVGYEVYYLAVDHNGKESLVQGPVYIGAKPAQEPQQNAIQIVDAKATDRYFDITLSGKPAEELSLANFSISCPASTSLHLGRMEKLSDTQYRLHMQEGYFFQDMNNYTVIITYSDKSISKHKFFVDLGRMEKLSDTQYRLHMQEGYFFQDMNNYTVIITYSDKSISKHKFFVDLSSPTFSMPTVTRNSDTEAIFDFQSNEKGTMWYLCLDKDLINSDVTVDQVLTQGTMISFVEGNNRITLNGVTAASKTLFYVYEDLLGNRVRFVDGVRIPEKSPETPQPPQGTVQITNLTVSKDFGPKNECTVLSLTFDYDVQADQMYVSADDIEITQNGSSTVYTGSKDIEVSTNASGVEIKFIKNLGMIDQMYVSADDIEITQNGSSTVYTGSKDIEVSTNASGVEIKFIKNLGMILPNGEYQIKVNLNKGTATKTFTVQS